MVTFFTRILKYKGLLFAFILILRMTCKVFLSKKDCNWNFFTCHFNCNLRHLHTYSKRFFGIYKLSKTLSFLDIQIVICCIFVFFGLYLKCFVGIFLHGSWQLRAFVLFWVKNVSAIWDFKTALHRKNEQI